MGTQDVDVVEWCDESFEWLTERNGRAKPLLFGLPCARCGAYYESELTTCPTCGSPERISTSEALVPLPRAA